MVKSGSRNVRGKLQAYLWKQLMPEINYIVDTQTAFKAFPADIARVVTEDKLVERAFCFDIELMLKAQLYVMDQKKAKGEWKEGFEPLGQCGIAWIDSEAESQSQDPNLYVNLLKALVPIFLTHLASRGGLTSQDVERRQSYATFLEGLDTTKWDRLLEHCPEGIASRDAADFRTWAEVTAAELVAASQGNK